ncbi:TPA: hypothetical protein HA251_01475 [Candidatus Woesearchaeota archaeon]|nr:hypothetical protein [Candidatus Woesearchaeota archaeon]
MRIVDVPFDLQKWSSCETSIVQPYTHGLIRQTLATQGVCSENDVIYRGGFGRLDDFDRLVATGTDYDSAIVADGDWRGHHAVYASPLERVAQEPWCRGFDPLYWALKGHRHGTAYNPVNAIVAYRMDAMVHIGSDIYAFKNRVPTTDAIATILLLRLQHKTSVYVERNIVSPLIAWRGRRVLARKMRRFIEESS